jgi:hypothetical protein
MHGPINIKLSIRVLLSHENTIPPPFHTNIDVHIHSFDKRDKYAKPGNLPKSKPLSEIGDDGKEKHSYLV